MTSASSSKLDEDDILNSPPPEQRHASLIDDLNEELFDEEQILGDLDAAGNLLVANPSSLISLRTETAGGNGLDAGVQEVNTSDIAAASTSANQLDELDYDEEPAAIRHSRTTTHDSDREDDEEDEQRSRRDKFTSERNTHQGSDSRSSYPHGGSCPTTATAATRPKYGPGKVLINPYYRGTIRSQSDVRLTWDPSLMSSQPGMIQVGAVKIIPPRPIGMSMMRGMPPRFNMPMPGRMPFHMPMVHQRPPMMLASTSMPVGMVPTIRPASTTSTGDWNSLVDGFLKKNASNRRQRSSSPPGTSSRSRSPRSRSTSYCSTCSSGSRSHSRTPKRSRSPPPGSMRRRRSLSNSRNGRRQQKHRAGPSRGGLSHRNDAVNRPPNFRHRHHPRTDHRNGGEPDGAKAQHRVSHSKRMEATSKECAVAIGLDNADDYLGRLEQQKRQRDEILRKKAERRNEQVKDIQKPGDQSKRPTQNTVSRRFPESGRNATATTRLKVAKPLADEKINSRYGAGSDSRQTVSGRSVITATGQAVSGRDEPQRVSVRDRLSDAPGTAKKSPTAVKAFGDAPRAAGSRLERSTGSGRNSSGNSGKKKPYLAVVVQNLAGWDSATSRLKIVADTIGKTKKIWQPDSDTVMMIFEDLEKAKQFMLQYNQKRLNGHQLRVKLEKIYENLAEI